MFEVVKVTLRGGSIGNNFFYDLPSNLPMSTTEASAERCKAFMHLAREGLARDEPAAWELMRLAPITYVNDRRSAV